MVKQNVWSWFVHFLCKQPWAFALLPCVAAFLVQITTLADEMINPTQTVVNTRRLNLSQLEAFPVVFKLCIQPGYNQTAIWEAGYSEVDLSESAPESLIGTFVLQAPPLRFNFNYHLFVAHITVYPSLPGGLLLCREESVQQAADRLGRITILVANLSLT